MTAVQSMINNAFTQVTKKIKQEIQQHQTPNNATILSCTEQIDFLHQTQLQDSVVVQRHTNQLPQMNTILKDQQLNMKKHKMTPT